MAQQICGGTPIAEALLAVRLRPRAAADEAARLLAELGFSTAMDRPLLLADGGPEVQELMDELKNSGVRLRDRGKVRLLVGDRAHLGRQNRAQSTDGMTFTGRDDHNVM